MRIKSLLSTFLLLVQVGLNGILFAQSKKNDDAYPKGKFEKVVTIPRNYNQLDLIYEAGAEKLVSEWKANGFTKITQGNKSLFSTGKYVADANLSATGPNVILPSIENGQRIILQLDENYTTENQYDFVSVNVSTDGGKTNELVYRKSGKSGSVSDYIDLSKFAGKSVALTLKLTADGINNSKGWDISKLAIYTATDGRVPSSTSLKSGASSLKMGSVVPSKIEILNIKNDNFPEAVFVEFRAEDAAGNFVSGLATEDLNILDNSSQKFGCLKLLQISEVMKPAVDIVFLVDNSGSMDDNQAKVQNNINDLLQQLAGEYDVNASLVRFGQSDNLCPEYALIESGIIVASEFSSLNSTADVDLFIDDIWSRNIAAGGYEPYYEVLNWAAEQPMNYRSNASKVFILIGDEEVSDGSNDKECNGNLSGLNATSVSAKLQAQNIQTFVIGDPLYFDVYSELNPVAIATGGTFEDITAMTYDVVLSNIGNSIREKYILRYCVEADPSDYTQDICRPVSISLKSDMTVTDNSCYSPIPQPRLVRTLATQDLDSKVQDQNKEVKVGAQVISQLPVSYVELYYKQYNEANYTVIANSSGIYNVDGPIFNFTIPAISVDQPMVQYFFRAHMANGSVIISSPAPDVDFFAWTFAVWPNYPPQITNVSEVGARRPCSPLTVCAKIVDNTESVSVKQLHYQVSLTPSVYVTIDMLPCPTCGVDYYCATIPAEAAQEAGYNYFINAEDNYGTQGWHGKPEAPINITYANIPQSTTGLMKIYIGNALDATMDCENLAATDEIVAYFMNECGNLQVGGIGKWDLRLPYILIKVYGDSDLSDGYKNGFYTGDKVYLKLVRNGMDYTIEPEYEIFYFPKGTEMLTGLVGPGVPYVEISGNNQLISSGNTITSQLDNTNFGACAAETAHTFTFNNSGCSDLLINGITINDANFVADNIVNQTIASGTSLNFNIAYTPNTDASATVLVYNNSAINPYTFVIEGTVEPVTPACDGVVIAYNPMPRYGSPILVTVDQLSSLSIKIADMSGAIVTNVFNSPTMGAGTHTFFVNASGLSSNNSYLLVVERNGTICTTVFTVNP